MAKQPTYDLPALKKEHGERLFMTPIVLPEEAGGDEIDLVWKPPSQGAYRIYEQARERAGIEQANRQLFLAVTVHPDLPFLRALADRCPVAVALFLNRGGVTNFFGDDTTVKETIAL